MPERDEVINFGAGPSALPTAALERAAAALVNYNGLGMGVAEISHRSKEAEQILSKAKGHIRELLAVPDDFSILFMQGGGSTQFAAIAYNMLAHHGSMAPADYVVTGSWSKKAADEAARLGIPVNVVADGKKQFGGYTDLPPAETYQLSSDPAYLYYCDNETIHGVEFARAPATKGVDLVADISSNMMSRKFDFTGHAIVYGGAQKNVGPAGLCIVMVRNDIIEKRASVEQLREAGVPIAPSTLDYALVAANNSLLNTLPIAPLHQICTCLELLIDAGGIKAVEQLNNDKSSLIYSALERHPELYRVVVKPAARSRMNIPFRIIPEELEPEFLKGASARGMLNLKGHRSVGGIRISLYNAIDLAATKKLADFIDEFGAAHSK